MTTLAKVDLTIEAIAPNHIKVVAVFPTGHTSEESFRSIGQAAAFAAKAQQRLSRRQGYDTRLSYVRA